MLRTCASSSQPWFSTKFFSRPWKSKSFLEFYKSDSIILYTCKPFQWILILIIFDCALSSLFVICFHSMTLDLTFNFYVRLFFFCLLLLLFFQFFLSFSIPPDGPSHLIRNTFVQNLAWICGWNKAECARKTKTNLFKLSQFINTFFSEFFFVHSLFK